MSKLQELLAQKEALEKQIVEMRKAELADAIKQVKALVAAHNLTQDDVFGKTRGAKTSKVKGSKVAAKYRDPSSGKEWSGRGLAPKWLQGKDKSQYLIA